MTREDLIDILHRYRRKEIPTADAAAGLIDSYIWSVVDAAQTKINATVSEVDALRRENQALREQDWDALKAHANRVLRAAATPASLPKSR